MPSSLHDLEVLPRLRHDRLVRRNDEEHGVDAASPREHVAHEALVAGNVHEGEPDALPLRMCEPEIDRDPAPLLFRQTVRVDSRQGLDQGGLAVVDVAGRAHEEAFHARKAIRR